MYGGGPGLLSPSAFMPGNRKAHKAKIEAISFNSKNTLLYLPYS